MHTVNTSSDQLSSNVFRYDTTMGHADTTMGRYQFHREHAFIRRFLGAAAPPRRLLEIGCGRGQIALALRDAGLNVVGLDINSVALDTFRRRSNQIPLIMGDGQYLPFADGSFDCVVAIQCFRYFDPQRFLQECNRMLCNSGLLIFQSVNERSYKRLFKRARRTFLEATDNQSSSGYLNCREVLRATVAHGFDIQGVSGYHWPPFAPPSDSVLVGPAALVEQVFRLDRYYSISPLILIAARKRNSYEHHLP